MKQFFLLLILINICTLSFAQAKATAGTYEVISYKMDSNTILTPTNKDSVIKVEIDKAFNKGFKNGGEPLTGEDSIQIINKVTSGANQVFNFKIVLKPDGKYNKLFKGRESTKFEIIETGTYLYNSKNNSFKLKPKIQHSEAEKTIMTYNNKLKTINFIAGKEEEFEGETILVLKKVK